MASNVSKNLALESHLADLNAVEATLLGRSRRGEFDVLDTKVGECLSNLHLGLGVKERVGELLALCGTTIEKARSVGLSNLGWQSYSQRRSLRTLRTLTREEESLTSEG